MLLERKKCNFSPVSHFFDKKSKSGSIKQKNKEIGNIARLISSAENFPGVSKDIFDVRNFDTDFIKRKPKLSRVNKQTKEMIKS